MAVEDDTVVSKSIDVGREDLIASMETDVIPTLKVEKPIVTQPHNNTWAPFSSLTTRTSLSGTILGSFVWCHLVLNDLCDNCNH